MATRVEADGYSQATRLITFHSDVNVNEIMKDMIHRRAHLWRHMQWFLSASKQPMQLADSKATDTMMEVFRGCFDIKVGRIEPERNAYRDFLESDEDFLLDDICKYPERKNKENQRPRRSIAQQFNSGHHQDGGHMVLTTRDHNIPQNVAEAAPSTSVQGGESGRSVETGWEVDEEAGDPETYWTLDF
jgi:hypothetical protein